MTPPVPALPSGGDLALLRHVHGTEWAGAVSGLVSRVEAVLPAGGTVEVHPTDEVVVVSWVSGPSLSGVRTVVSDAFGAGPVYTDEGFVSGWPGLELRLHRSATPAARGLALLAAGLSGECPWCDFSTESFYVSYAEALERPSPELVSSHSNLSGLVSLGFPAVRLERLGELLGGLGGDDQVEAAEFFHAAGHLPGIAALADGLGVPA